MKEHGLFIAIIATLFSTITTWIMCSMFYKDKLKSEYLRGFKKGHDTHLIDSVTYGDIFYDTTSTIHYFHDTIRMEKQ